MKHPIKSFTLFLLFSIISFYSFVAVSNGKSTAIIDGYVAKKSAPQAPANEPRKKVVKEDNTNYDLFLQDIMRMVKKDYVQEKSKKELAEAAASGILSSLDPHSAYLDAESLKEMHVQTEGKFGGLGIEITMEHSLVKIVSPIEGTPAAREGIKAGDYISKINSKSVVGLNINDVVKKLRGKPRTKVNITILRKGQKTPIDLTIQREIIKIKAVRSNAEGDIAYIKINTFSNQAYIGVRTALNKLIKEQIGTDKIKGIVLDLRNNPGGLLDSSLKISDIFLDKNQTIVSIKGRDEDSEKIYKDGADQTITKDIPVVVLINEGSASASEIVAGALQDNKRALVVGLKSFGKGSVQSVIPLRANKGALKMTTALYYTPSGKSIQAHGIEPDIVVKEAKIEVIEKDQENIRSEASLSGHLKGQIDDEIKNAQKSQIGDDNLELYDQDYQLARAIDLLRGISVYKAIYK